MPRKYLYENNPNKRRIYMEQDRRAKARRYVARIEFIRSIKETNPCIDCGRHFPHYIMEFDHVRGTKELNISSSNNINSWDKLLAEIDKCDIICSNCHATRTWFRKVKSKSE